MQVAYDRFTNLRWACQQLGPAVLLGPSGKPQQHMDHTAVDMQDGDPMVPVLTPVSA